MRALLAASSSLRPGLVPPAADEGFFQLGHGRVAGKAKVGLQRGGGLLHDMQIALASEQARDVAEAGVLAFEIAGGEAWADEAQQGAQALQAAARVMDAGGAAAGVESGDRDGDLLAGNAMQAVGDVLVEFEAVSHRRARKCKRGCRTDPLCRPLVPAGGATIRVPVVTIPAIVDAAVAWLTRAGQLQPFSDAGFRVGMREEIGDHGSRVGAGGEHRGGALGGQAADGDEGEIGRCVASRGGSCRGPGAPTSSL